MYTGYSESHERDGVMLVAMRAARNCRERPQKPGERERERELELASADGGWVARVWLAPVAGGSRG